MTAQTTAHRPARINPDHLAVLIVAASLTGLLAVTSFLLSFVGLSAVAVWASVPWWLTWAVPVMIDSAILVYTLAALVLRARGEKTGRTWCSLALWAAVSVAANAIHAWVDAPSELQTVTGMIIAGLAPVALLLATHTLVDLIVAKPDTAAASAVVADGQANSGRTNSAPDPLVVLEQIETAPRADAGAEQAASASAGQTDGHEDGQRAADTAADDGRRTRPVRERRPAGSVEAVRPQIEALARQGLKGREIARRLGTGPTRTCEIVREVREAGTRFELLQETYPA